MELVKAIANSAAWYGAGGVPAWSGSFTDLGAGLGVMRIWAGDTHNYQAPEGWRFLVAEPAYAPELDAECWLLERIGE